MAKLELRANNINITLILAAIIIASLGSTLDEGPDTGPPCG
jgi:hypothetical protein